MRKQKLLNIQMVLDVFQSPLFLSAKHADTAATLEKDCQTRTSGSTLRKGTMDEGILGEMWTIRSRIQHGNIQQTVQLIIGQVSHPLMHMIMLVAHRLVSQI